MNTIKEYYGLTKPGIIRGNAVTAAAGFFLASQHLVNLGVFLAMLAGLSLVVASACVFNNYIDRGIDAKMKRTSKRALVTRHIPVRSSIIFGLVLGIGGATILALYTNTLTLGLALFGFFAYVVIYGAAKRRTVHGTIVGSISGAVPPVVGYVAVTGHFDIAAAILFLILVIWQMPHFYAIALYRLDDYAAADIPVLPLRKGIPSTKIQMFAYIIAFLIVTVSLWTFGFVGYSYLGVVLLLGVSWLAMSWRGFSTKDDKAWARQMFRFSLLVITGTSVAIAFSAILP